MELSHDCHRVLGPSWVRDASSSRNTSGSIAAGTSSKRCLGIHSWWGTFSAGPAAWLTPSWLSMLGFELSLPRCGGVWAAQCLNSLMTMLGCCPCPARPP